jgi:hypothetical protein
MASHRVFENSVLRKILGPKRQRVTGASRNLHHDLYSSPNITGAMKSMRKTWARHVARMGENRNAYGVLVGKPKRKDPLRIPRCRLQDSIKTLCGDGFMDFIHRPESKI